MTTSCDRRSSLGAQAPVCMGLDDVLSILGRSCSCGCSLISGEGRRCHSPSLSSLICAKVLTRPGSGSLPVQCMGIS